MYTYHLTKNRLLDFLVLIRNFLFYFISRTRQDGGAVYNRPTATMTFNDFATFTENTCFEVRDPLLGGVLFFFTGRSLHVAAPLLLLYDACHLYDTGICVARFCFCLLRQMFLTNDALRPRNYPIRHALRIPFVLCTLLPVFHLNHGNHSSFVSSLTIFLHKSGLIGLLLITIRSFSSDT